MVRRYALLSLWAATTLALSACGGSGVSDSGETSATRTIEHAAGESQVPESPERVVILDTAELDSAITLGVTPVGAVEAVEGMGFPDYLGETEGIDTVGTIAEPNLEKIAALEPDLILSSSLRHEQIYPELSEIAPTVFTESTGASWRENFRKHAEALGMRDEAKEKVAEYESRLEEFKNTVEEPRPTTSIVRFVPGDTRIYQKDSFIGTLLEDAGLPRPEPQDEDEFALLNVSEEAIPDMDGDVIFTTVYGEEEKTAQAGITSSQLWQELEAVQNDRVYRVSDDVWMLGIGYTAAGEVLDDLFGHVPEDGSTGVRSTTMEATSSG
ncbi:ABC transporter substrate-binding protein [Rubrobacter aplysinae]|uniref:ABC transporter substrate-binding protein n=1 Tax=Rubrobacter aplysinae TaxID=909625 RepID=UPI00064C4890|nr:iron-siderophore ABC transporter substrate-binding protein [Rubrobacter aplysinae]